MKLAPKGHWFRMLVLIVAVLAAFKSSVACADDVDAASIVKSMQGRWRFTEVVLYGRPQPMDIGKEVTIDGNQWRSGNRVDIFKIIADKTPMQIDFKLVEPPEIRGKGNGNDEAWGIISVEKDTLKVCTHWGNARARRIPKAFDDATAFSYSLKRVAPPKPPSTH